MMRRLAAALIAAVCVAAALPLSASAKQKYTEPGLELAPISGEKVDATDDGVVIDDEDVYVAGVKAVYFDDRLIEVRTDYTVGRDGAVVVRFKQSFLEGVKPGKYIVRVEFVSHFAETTYELADTGGYYSAAPPAAKWPR